MRLQPKPIAQQEPHRMLSEKGNPSMDNLAAIFGALRKQMGVVLKAQVIEGV